jgi:short-subunit dehydrogenase
MVWSQDPDAVSGREVHRKDPVETSYALHERGRLRKEAMATITHALVTGASSGLGRELVRQLVRDRGATVLATARRLDRLEELAGEFPSGRVNFLAGDLTDPEFRHRLWQHAIAAPGGVDLLINNAGMGHYAPFADQDPCSIRQIIELNLMALMDLSQKAARHMRARGRGQILQISSVLGYVGIPYSAVYVASKHAVNGLVKSMRYELRGTGVNVWAACPGRTESEFSEKAMGARGDTSRLPQREPTARVVRSILRGLDRSHAFLIPSWTTRAGLVFADWCPALFDLLIVRWADRHVGSALKPLPSKQRPDGEG